jgi:hypothetical protein
MQMSRTTIFLWFLLALVLVYGFDTWKKSREKLTMLNESQLKDGWGNTTLVPDGVQTKV